MKPKCFIFDIDMTLSYPVNRGPYGSGADDEIIEPTITLIHSICARSLMLSNLPIGRISIILLSGRKFEDHYDDTIGWCIRHDVRFEHIYLNDTKPCQKNEVFKKGKLLELQEKFNILGVFDDDPLVADVCRELGIPSFLFSYNN